MKLRAQAVLCILYTLMKGLVCPKLFSPGLFGPVLSNGAICILTELFCPGLY